MKTILTKDSKGNFLCFFLFFLYIFPHLSTTKVSTSFSSVSQSMPLSTNPFFRRHTLPPSQACSTRSYDNNEPPCTLVWCRLPFQHDHSDHCGTKTIHKRLQFNVASSFLVEFFRRFLRTPPLTQADLVFFTLLSSSCSLCSLH